VVSSRRGGGALPYERATSDAEAYRCAAGDGYLQSSRSSLTAVASELRANIGGIEVSTAIKIALTEIEERLAETFLR
jgi:hypothetical protein